MLLNIGGGRCFQAAETEIQIVVVKIRARKKSGIRPAGGGQCVHEASAGVGQAQQFAHFVKGLTRRVIQSPAQRQATPGRLKPVNMGVTAGNQQT